MSENEISRRGALTGIAGAAAGLALTSWVWPADAAHAETAGVGAFGRTEGDRLETYPIPADITQNTSFKVKVRNPGGKWQTVSTYLAKFQIVDPVTGRGAVRSSSMAYFDFSGTVEVSVIFTKGRIETARIRPLSFGITHEVERRDTLSFTLTEPRNLSIEVNGDIFDNLQLFAGPVETNQPAAGDPDVIYFGPGVHSPLGGSVLVPSGTTVYLAGGAVLKADVKFVHVENARLIGRGVISNPSGGACRVESSKNIEIDGVTMLNPAGYALTAAETQNLTIKNIRSLSSAQWGDGLDFFCCKDVLVDGVFMRNSDDCIAIYNHRWDYYGDTRNIIVRNSTLWADVAHPVNVGTHGNTANPETIENLTFSNIDILDHREPQMDYQGCIALNAGDSNLIRNVRIEDVRVEDFRWGQLVNMRVMYNKSYNTSPGRGIETVYIKNLSYTGTHANPSILVGYDADHLIKDVTFENLVLNGKVVSDTDGHARWYKTSDFVPMFTNEHVRNLRFLPSGA